MDTFSNAVSLTIGENHRLMDASLLAAVAPRPEGQSYYYRRYTGITASLLMDYFFLSPALVTLVAVSSRLGSSGWRLRTPRRLATLCTPICDL